MKQLSRIASAVALAAAGLFAASQASAATICANCLYTAAGTTYLGSHNPNSNDGSGFRRQDVAVAVPTFVQDTWVFDVFPVSGSAQINANFIPIIPSAFSNFTVDLYSATHACVAIGNAAGSTGFCPGVVLNGGPLASSVAAVGGANLFPIGLAAGQYAFVVSYTANVLPVGETAEYSGQLRLRPLPEPGSLALVGLALVGVAATMRRARKA